MRSLFLIVPGDLDTRTGGYGYDRRVIGGLRDRGWSVDVLALDQSFPFPTAAARDHAARVLASIPDGAIVLVDGLALGALPEEVGRERERLILVALVHHPLALETGLEPAAAAALEDSERRALAGVRFVIVTSRGTAQSLAAYGVSADRLAIVEPGTDRAPLARGSAGQKPSALSPEPSEVALLCVASLTPRKGYELLFRALAAIPHRGWRLTCAGSLDRDRATVERLLTQLRAEGLTDRVSLIGDLDADALAIEYDRADLFVLATWYEGYGMAVAEALARGVPVVSTATGAIERLVAGQPGHEAGLVVPPGDLDAFTRALEWAIGDPALRSRLAEGARRVREQLPTWDDAIADMDRVLSGGHSVPPAPYSGPVLRPRTPAPYSGPVLRPRTPAPYSGPVLRHGTPARYSGTVLRHGTPAPGFTADWLALREGADRSARSMRLTRAIADALPHDREVRVLDLGAGTGANLRFLAPHLPRPQDWLLVDNDPALLARVSALDVPRDRVQTRELDLRRLGPDERAVFASRALVTASALLDLVSADWVRGLAARCQEIGAAALFALSYDGRIECSPEESEDAEIRDLVNLHQRTDKGFGRALGPDASRTTADCFVDLGYRVERERSDWILDPDARALQHQLIDGWAQAAAEIAPARASSIAKWRDRRLAHVAAGRSQILVGHEDLAGFPPGM